MTNVNKMEEEPSNDIFSAVFFSQKTISKLRHMNLMFVCNKDSVIFRTFDMKRIIIETTN